MITFTKDAATSPPVWRVIAAAVALLLLGGAMTGGLAEVVASPNTQGAPVLHVATVAATPAATATEVSVQFSPGGTTHRFPFQTPYVPVAGDQVNVLLLSGSGSALSGLVLGGRSGQSGNLVLNGSFSEAPQFPLPATVSLLPHHWTQYTASGQVAILAGEYHDIFQRKVLLFAINTGVAGDNYVVSAAFPVVPGERLYIDSLSEFNVFAPTPTTVTVQLRVAWFTAATGNYPGFSAETLIGQYSGNVSDEDWIGGSVVVPAGALFGRVSMRITNSGGGLNYTATISEVSARRR